MELLVFGCVLSCGMPLLGGSLRGVLGIQV